MDSGYSSLKSRRPLVRVVKVVQRSKHRFRGLHVCDHHIPASTFLAFASDYYRDPCSVDTDSSKFVNLLGTSLLLKDDITL